MMKTTIAILLAVTALALSGCPRPEAPKGQARVPEIFSAAKATALADVFLVEQKLKWGTPIEVKPHELNGDVVQYKLYYETPEGEDARLGKRGLIVTREGQVQRTVRR